MKVNQTPIQATVLILTGLLAGCAVGPNFKRPAAPSVSTYTVAAMPEQTVSAPITMGAAQHFSTATHVSEYWWRSLGSPQLNTLIAQAFQSIR